MGGCLPGRWRRVSVALVAAGLLVGLVGLAPGIVAVAGHDVHVEASGNLSAPSRAWAIAGYMTIIAVLASWLAWLVVQVPGYRRSSGERREQLKWLYSGATAFWLLWIRPVRCPARPFDPWIGPLLAAIFSTSG